MTDVVSGAVERGWRSRRVSQRNKRIAPEAADGPRSKPQDLSNTGFHRLQIAGRKPAMLRRQAALVDRAHLITHGCRAWPGRGHSHHDRRTGHRRAGERHDHHGSPRAIESIHAEHHRRPRLPDLAAQRRVKVDPPYLASSHPARSSPSTTVAASQASISAASASSRSTMSAVSYSGSLVSSGRAASIKPFTKRLRCRARHRPPEPGDQLVGQINQELRHQPTSAALLSLSIVSRRICGQ